MQQVTSHTMPLPAPGSAAEKRQFAVLQQQLPHQFRYHFPDKLAPKTVVIVPSLTLDADILQKVKGVAHYEERLLCLLMLLRMPHTHVVYVTSAPIDPVVIDYYLHLLPGITSLHARQRLHLFSCYDAVSPQSLTEKLLRRPRLLQRIRQCIPPHHASHLVCFTVTPLERTLSVALQLPLYGTDPELATLGNKSESRKLFRQCGIPLPDGAEDLYHQREVAEALLALRQRQPQLQKAVVKMNEGFSGEGNAIYHYAEAQTLAQIGSSLHTQLQVVADDLDPAAFWQKFESMGGVVEAFVEGAVKTSPSVQCRIDPAGGCTVISTHDQMLGGPDEQVYQGATFPANPAYAGQLARLCQPLMQRLQQQGVLGRFGIDFMSVQQSHGGWAHHAIEINLRKGGTTHPFLMLQMLTEGHYDAEAGTFTLPNGECRYYTCTDNLSADAYRGLTPHDLIDMAMENGLLYNSATQTGVMFHMISALSAYGKIGLICIGKTSAHAAQLYTDTEAALYAAACRC